MRVSQAALMIAGLALTLSDNPAEISVYGESANIKQPDSVRCKPSGSCPVSGGGQRERERRLRKMQAKALAGVK